MTILESIPFLGTSCHLSLVLFHAFCHQTIDSRTFLALGGNPIIGWQWDLFGLGIAIDTNFVGCFFGGGIGSFGKPSPHGKE